MSAIPTQTLEQLAAEMHAGQVDKQDRPYIEHVLAVAAAVSDDAKPVALFHDALEDQRATLLTLSRFLSDDELAAVEIVTRDKSRETYAAFIEQIATAPGRPGALAREVKIADLRHNLGRMTDEIRRAKPQLAERYQRALERLA